MATTSTQLNVDETPILTAVRQMYEDVADHPNREFHFPTGREACLYVGYPQQELDALPTSAVESFAGVGYPFRADVIKEGDFVMDIGSGSGVDALIAGHKTGPSGRVVGIDMTPAMIRKATDNISKAGLDHVEIREGRADDLPLDDATVDVVTSNGVLNLVPDKQRAFREAFRVLKPGGRLQIADIVLSKAVSLESKRNPQLWAECIVGALEHDIYLDLAREAGFQDVRVVDQLDYFDRSANDSTKKAAKGLGAHTIVFTARKA